jgi:hypothetical protein
MTLPTPVDTRSWHDGTTQAAFFSDDALLPEDSSSRGASPICSRDQSMLDTPSRLSDTVGSGQWPLVDIRVRDRSAAQAWLVSVPTQLPHGATKHRGRGTSFREICFQAAGTAGEARPNRLGQVQFRSAPLGSWRLRMQPLLPNHENSPSQYFITSREVVTRDFRFMRKCGRSDKCE